MRLAYLDAFAGISGDMLLGAFIHAGAPVDLLHRSLAALNIGASLKVDQVDRSGIHAVKVSIMADGRLAESNGHEHGHHDHHRKNNGAAHVHAEEARTLDAIVCLISKADLPGPVKALAIRAFQLLGQAEAKIHHAPLGSIHFHEVGAVDAIADIVLAAVAAHALQIEKWYCSPLNVGSGTVHCAHGRFPVPAPATAELLLGAPTYSSGIQAELVTPTGAALVRAFGCEFGPLPALQVDAIGYGAGTRNPRDFANVLRLNLGEMPSAAGSSENVLVMEVAIDDLSPQVIAYVSEKALELGALDVMCTPVFMKKNRPGTLMTLLSDRAHAAALQDLLLRETSTLGLRIHEERRVCLERKHVDVTTEWGPVRVKVGYRDSAEWNVAPEFSDCRALAESRAVPVKRVMEAALVAYRKDHP
jgi:uncharacterized protein (TIGR00299 family) protein